MTVFTIWLALLLCNIAIVAAGSHLYYGILQRISTMSGGLKLQIAVIMTALTFSATATASTYLYSILEVVRTVQ
jgi:hypothetical protein